MSGDEASDDEEMMPSLEDIMKWKKKEMEKWLMDRQLPRSSKRKEILAQRILRHLVGEDDDDDEDDDEDESSSPESACHVLLPVCPGKDDAKWVSLTQPNQIPNIREEDITNYYVHGKNPITGGLKNCKRYLEKAQKFGKEHKYITNLGVCSEGNFSLFKSQVRPSMKKGMYYCTVTLHNDTGMVAGARCDCKVGAVGLCAHVGGVMFRLIRLKNPCTSTLCMWAKPPEKNIEPQKLSEINWWPGKADVDKPWPHVFKAGPCDSSDEHSKSFREEILDGLETANPQCVLYIHQRKSIVNLQDFLDIFTVPVTIDDDTDLESTFAQDLMKDFFEDLATNMTKADWQALSIKVEKGTRGQGCNPHWYKVRNLIVTASNFGRIMSMRTSTKPDNLLAQLCGYVEVPKTMAIVYGNKYESKARKLYMKYHQKKCAGDGKLVSVDNLGLVVSIDHPYLGASLDGFVQCPKCGDGALEIKCSWKHRKLLATDIPSRDSSFYCTSTSEGTLQLKKSHRYWYQIQGQMGVTGLQWADFVVYTQRGISVERVPFDSQVWDVMIERLGEFYLKNRVAEMFTGRVKRHIPLY